MYTPGTIVNSQTEREPTKTNKNVAVTKVYKSFSRTRDTIRHLKTFRVISNETSFLLFIIIGCFFSCLKMYSDKFFNSYFYVQIFFLKSLWQRERHVSYF